MKQQKKTKMFNVLIIIDDFADCSSFSRNSKLLHALYTRGRHAFLSTITATSIGSFITCNKKERYGNVCV